MAYATKHTIMIEYEKTTTIDQLFSLVFWRNKLLADDAKKIWKEIKEAGKEGFQGRQWKFFLNKAQLNLNNLQMLYLVLRTLRAVGFIYKKGQTYFISHSFLNKLEAMIETYEKITGFRSSLRVA